MSIKNFRNALTKFAEAYVAMGNVLGYLEEMDVRQEVIEFIVEKKEEVEAKVEAKKEKVIKPEKPIAVKTEKPFADTQIENLGLPTHSYNALKSNDINWISELIQMTRPQLLRLRRIGKNSIFEITNALDARGLSLLGDCND